ncbi:glycosyltransferase family 2 protein [Aestuariivirga sp.]|uniref:glycosyltransferase family 2 protein n=1 Tax=Aestuariivirga sp. TaxID=2650926 RepID=UPI003BAA67D9
MLDTAPASNARPVMEKLRFPRVTIVIPHYNYSEFVGDALQSVKQQSYQNIACVVVDDCSSPDHWAALQREFAQVADERFTLIQAPENKGMVHAIYRGISERPSSFVCVLDPDDRYDPQFIRKMLDVHLNRVIFCPLASCDQHLFKIGDGIITSTQYTSRLEQLGTSAEEAEHASFARYGFHKFVSPLETGWHWCTTSSMMFRTDALLTFKPIKDFAYKGQGDSYCANGAHMLGGSLILHEALVYRGLHTKNDFITNSIFSMWQRQERQGVVHLSDEVKIDVIEAFFANGGLDHFTPGSIREVLLAQFPEGELDKLMNAVPAAAELISAGQ